MRRVRSGAVEPAVACINGAAASPRGSRACISTPRAFSLLGAAAVLAFAGVPSASAQLSIKSCAQLGWPFGSPGTHPFVCSKSDTGLAFAIAKGLPTDPAPPNCPGSRDYFGDGNAVDYCATLGARLCTTNELYAGVQSAGNCGFMDALLVWTSTACERAAFNGSTAAVATDVGQSRCRNTNNAFSHNAEILAGVGDLGGCDVFEAAHVWTGSVCSTQTYVGTVAIRRNALDVRCRNPANTFSHNAEILAGVGDLGGCDVFEAAHVWTGSVCSTQTYVGTVAIRRNALDVRCRNPANTFSHNPASEPASEPAAAPASELASAASLLAVPANFAA
ncbi:hypothetical protein KFE25_003121 [Diacronema lutheri]|uniref:Uncharacterized protein n=1 Tax=Diacronema lutheri TaxID=2081491 RepID=A0A8J6C3W7_DIALT|nr:hypothetical protein KFE25_003121 [Diacronema lutheri]